jgi:tight adherence protein C
VDFSPTIIAFDVLAFAVAVAIVVVVSMRLETRQSVRRRLGEEAPKKTLSASAARRATLVRAQGPRSPILAWVQRTTLQDQKEASVLRRDLALAGFESQSAPAIYVICRFTLAVGLPCGYIFSQKFMHHELSGLQPIMFALGAAAVGLIAPRSFIDNRANARKEGLEHEFPDALDLMVVCVESGLGLEGALLRVGQETKISHPRVSEEFELVSQELRVGRTRADALRNMGERTGVDVVKAFVTLLIQTDSLGGSIAQALRTYSDEMRKHRMLKAEEKAMRLPVLLTIPLVACILPVIFVAVMLPAFIDLSRNLLPAMGGK